MMISEQEILDASILIVDDQESNVRLLEQMLGAASYRYMTSTMDSHVVCAPRRDDHDDLILLDLQMPGMDGFQAMEGPNEIETDGYLRLLLITPRSERDCPLGAAPAAWAWSRLCGAFMGVCARS